MRTMQILLVLSSRGSSTHDTLPSVDNKPWLMLVALVASLSLIVLLFHWDLPKILSDQVENRIVNHMVPFLFSIIITFLFED